MTAKRKLIRRNAHKMIAKIFEDSTTAKVYTLNNGFVGESVGVEWVKKHTANISHAEHYDNLDGTYTIRIHSNLWYELGCENKGPDSEPDEIERDLETSIGQLSNMIVGLDIAIARAKGLRERFIFHYEPFENSEGLTFSLDTLIGILRKDKAELDQSRKELQKRIA